MDSGYALKLVIRAGGAIRLWIVADGPAAADSCAVSAPALNAATIANFRKSLMITS